MIFTKSVREVELEQRNKALLNEVMKLERILKETSSMILAYPGEGNAAYRVCNQRYYETSYAEEEKRILENRKASQSKVFNF